MLRQVMHLLELPIEVQQRIFSLLDLRSMLCLQSTCKWFYQTCNIIGNAVTVWKDFGHPGSTCRLYNGMISMSHAQYLLFGVYAERHPETLLSIRVIVLVHLQKNGDPTPFPFKHPPPNLKEIVNV